MAQLSFPLHRRVLILALVAAGVIGSLAFYRTRTPAAGLAWFAPNNTAVPAQSALSSNAVATMESYDQAIEGLAEHVKPAVVEITVAARTSANGPQSPMEQFFGQFMGQPPQQPRIEHGIGSGVIISPNGYIVTNNHVVEGATNIEVTMTNSQIYPGKVIGTDSLTDLAVVKIDGADLPTLSWGDSTQLKPGQTVLAVGNPFGAFAFSVTRGIVSGLGRPRLNRSDMRALGDMVQTDAAINPGNSGGPLVDVHGDVIGINTAIFTPSGAFAGVGFAIPSQIAEKVAQDLIKNGKVEHGYLGIIIGNVTPDMMRFFNLKQARGALVNQVDPNAPGAKAGLKAGDVITAINGQLLQDSGQLQEITSLSPPGTRVTLEVMRNGQPLTLHATLGSAPAQAASTGAAEQPSTTGFRLGVYAGDLTQNVREQLNAPPGIQGAVISSVAQGGPADNGGLVPGMIIEEVNHQPVRDASELSQALAKLPPNQPILLKIWFNGNSTFLVVHPNESAH